MLTAKKTMAAALAGAMALSSTVAVAQTAPVSAPLRVGAPVKKAEKISGRTLGIVRRWVARRSRSAPDRYCLVGVQKGALGALFCLRSRCCEDAPGAA